MEPSLHLDDFVLVNTQAYAEQTPRRGDIVIYNAPSAPTRFFIHRVIGLPGEHISVKQGKVSINGMPLNEPYTSSIAKYEGEWDLKDNECFVLGDNRANSADSHLTGALPIKNIIGKVVLVYWPPSHWGNVPEIRYAP